MKNQTINYHFDRDSRIAVSVQNLTKNYHKYRALNDLTLELHAGEIIGLIGANGSGKTTFFKICNGLLDATEGSVSVLGGNPLTDIRVKNEMIYSMHNLPVGDRERLTHVLTYYQLLYPQFDLEFAHKSLELFSFYLNKRLSALSQGMKSLFHLICAIATRCQITMLDEPFIGIDIERRKLVYEILLRDYMEHPRTFIISSHNLSELEHVLSEMVLIHNGKLIFYEEMDAVRDMLIRVDGDRETLQEYAAAHDVLQLSDKELGSFAIVQGSINSPASQDALQRGLETTPVAPEDVCVYLTSEGKEAALECLWN